jgi:hypothetical protein
MVRSSACVVLLLLLSGCITGAAFTCADLKRYSPDKQKVIAKQLAAIRKEHPELAELVGDYGQLRKGLRKACPSQ